MANLFKAVSTWRQQWFGYTGSDGNATWAPEVALASSSGSISAANPLPVSGNPTSLSPNQTFASASATGANSAIAPALPAVAGKTNYIMGFNVTADGSTTATAGTVTLTGLLGGTLSFAFSWPTGAAIGAVPLTVQFPFPIPASAANTAITLNVPAGGAGNTITAANLYGFNQ